jgi:UDP-N-acetylmuramoyl-tripeptide--D-alanyl-D-alanine ligase
MDSRSLKFVAAACAGELLNGSPDLTVARVCSDSRKVQSGDLFFAISGERFDGHDFLAEVAQKGAAAVVAARARIPATLPCATIAVDDPRAALGRLAGKYREEFSLPVIAVGGSNGKTSTKELLASVLRQKLNTLWSEASFNNDIGVPLTMLRLEKTHQAAVFEVGTNHPGELAPLVRLVHPRFGVLTNVGREHLEFFGDLDGVAREEGWLAELLPADGRLFVNGDDAGTRKVIGRTRATVIRVGLGPQNDWRADEIRMDERGTQFRMYAPQAAWWGEYRINLFGRHQVVNALFALAVGAELNMSMNDMQKGLAESQPAGMRLQMRDCNGVRVLNDAYNANADSVLAALETLRELPCTGRRAAVLGDFAELGPHTRPAHEEAGRRAAELGLDHLFTVGNLAGITAGAARAAGLVSVSEFAEIPAAAAAVKEYLKPGDLLLLKASRAARLERLLEALMTPATTGNN